MGNIEKKLTKVVKLEGN